MDTTSRWWSTYVAGAMAVTAFYGVMAPAQVQQASAKEMVKAMVFRENIAANDQVRYSYLSEERSERTRGHLWTERMVETDWGTVRYLLAVDGKALAGDQVMIEKGRLAVQTSDPESYKHQELKEDESEHYEQMLTVMPKAFLFDLLDQNTQEIRIGYRPDPSFGPQTMEERALHGITGVLVLDAKTLRLHRLEGRAPNDVSLGFGPFATLRAGSNFATDREQMQDAVWRTASVRTSVQGRALLIKTIARQEEYRHSEFQRVPANLSLPAAVALAER